MQVPACLPGSDSYIRAQRWAYLGIPGGQTTVFGILTAWFPDVDTDMLFVPLAPVEN